MHLGWGLTPAYSPRSSFPLSGVLWAPGGCCPALHLHSLMTYRALTAQLGGNYVAGYFGKSRLLKTKIFCVTLPFFLSFFPPLLLLISARKWRRIIFKPVFLPHPAWLASWGSLAGSSARWAPAQHLHLPPQLLCSSPSSAAQYFSKLFAQTYNNIIFSHLQSHHGAKSLQVPALKSSCSLAAEELRLILSPSEVVYFTFT